MKIYSIDELMAGCLVRPKAPAVAPMPPWEGPERAGDAFNRVHRIDDILALLGFHSPQADNQGAHWTRAGKDPGQGTSATVFNDDPSKVTIWSSSCSEWWPHLEVNKPYDAFGLLVATTYGGDFSKAAEDLRIEGYGDDDEQASTLIDELQAFLASTVERMDAETDLIYGTDNGWDPINLTDPRYSTPPSPPDLFSRSDGTHLLYSKRIHYFYGIPESLKSWGAQVAVVWAITDGATVVILDFENDAWSIRDRLLSLGATDEQLLRVAYFNPSGHYTDTQWDAFKRLLAQAQLVIVDGVSNGMSLLGLSPLNHDDAVKFDLNFLRPLTAGGAAVVAIDHAPKNSEAPSVFGAQHKKAAVTGAMFRFEVIKPFGRGLRGVARMLLDKDKPGYLRQFVENGAIADLVLTSRSDGTVDAQLNVPTLTAERPTRIMDSLSRYIERNAGVSLADWKSNGTLSTKSSVVHKAVEILLDEGYVVREGTKYHSKRIYRDGAENAPFRQAPSLPAAPPPVVPPRPPVAEQLSIPAPEEEPVDLPDAFRDDIESQDYAELDQE